MAPKGKAKAKVKAKGKPKAVMMRPAAHQVDDAEPEGEEEEQAEGDEEMPSPAPGGQGAAAVASSTPGRGSPAPAGGAEQWVLVTKPEAPRLKVGYETSDSGGAAALVSGLVRLRRAGQLCDVTVIAGAGRIAAHSTVLAAHSEIISAKLQEARELDLSSISHEAGDLVVRWMYGEVDAANYRPSTAKVNEEVLQATSELGLPLMAELCAKKLADDADTSNVVARVKLCEEFGLPRLRAALVTAIGQDPKALDAVAKDPATLGHPALMRELLASIAAQASEPDRGLGGPPKKRGRGA